MAAGDVLTMREHKRISAAVAEAERACGLQLCVYVGRGSDSPREHAKQVFTQLALHDVPGVLLWLSPSQHRVEILTSPSARARVSDEACERAIEAAREAFARRRFAEGVRIAFAVIAEAAGPGPESGPEMPDVIHE